MLEIKRFKEQVLFKKARAVRKDEFGAELEAKMSEMATTMYGARGVGLAGPQINDSRRILVADLSYVKGDDYGTELIKMVNPEIISYSEEEAVSEEGCLSYPGLAVKIKRPVAVHVKFFSPSGEERSGTFNDWQARIILHENDHLDGTTLYSRSSRLVRKRYDKKISKVLKK